MILYDFVCPCGEQFEDLVPSGTPEVDCPVCKNKAQRAMSAPNIRSVINDPERMRASLEKRSYAHSMKDKRKNPEKLTKIMGGKPASQARWNIRSKS